MEVGVGEEIPPGGGWVSAASLAEGGVGLDTFLARDDAQVLRDYGVHARPDVVAGFGLHRYAWPACLLITVPWFLHRRVPRLPVGHVSYDRTVPGLSIGPCGAMRPLPLERKAPPPTRDRVSCCMFFTVRPEDTCATCPRTCDAGRVGKLWAAAAS